MSPEEKIQYVKNQIDEGATISPKGPFWLFLYTVSHPDNEEWTILERSEQRRIIMKLEQERYIKNVTPDANGKGFWLEKVQKRGPRKSAPLRRSNLYSRIKSTDQLLQERELFQKALQIFGEIEPRHKYTTSTNEENDDLIQLLIDLDLVQYDWKEIEKQTHRVVGNRIIEFSFEADKIIALKDRISGKYGRVKKEALELISKDIGERYTLDKIVRVFTDAGVPETMFIHDTKWRAVFYVLSYYSTSGDEDGKGFSQLIQILEKVLHPLAFDGDESKAKETRFKYNSYLKYDKIQLPDNQFLFERRHLNRMKEIYIYSVINLHKHSDGDYLCDDASELLRKYNIGRNDYSFAIERLEKEGVITYQEKYYETDHSEGSYDGRKVDHEKLTQLINTYRGWLRYKDEIDLLTVKVLADEIRKLYNEENLLDAIATLSEGIYIKLQNNLEEILYFYLSTKDEMVLLPKDGIGLLARMFDLKYHNVDELLKRESGFFVAISTLFSEVLDSEHYKKWYDQLPQYVKKAETLSDKSELYITKSKGYFLYKGQKIENLSEDADYYKVFSILFDLLPDGYGLVSYATLEKKVCEHISKTKVMSQVKLRAFIQRNLTDMQNGFLRYAKITDPNLLKSKTGKGIEFNNQKT